MNTSERTHTGQAWRGLIVSCINCGASKTATRDQIRMGEEIMEMWPCQGSDNCTAMLCEHCLKTCPGCGLNTCEKHLVEIPAEGESPAELRCECCRADVILADQESAALVCAMARQANEDLLDMAGAGLTINEARMFARVSAYGVN